MSHAKKIKENLKGESLLSTKGSLFIFFMRRMPQHECTRKLCFRSARVGVGSFTFFEPTHRRKAANAASRGHEKALLSKCPSGRGSFTLFEPTHRRKAANAAPRVHEKAMLSKCTSGRGSFTFFPTLLPIPALPGTGSHLRPSRGRAPDTGRQRQPL